MKLSDLLMIEARSESRAETGLRSKSVQDIIDEEVEIFNETPSITNFNNIPETTRIPIENPLHWIKVPNVIACFVDMEGSTKLSVSTHHNNTARAYRLFTSTITNIFHLFDASYIDIKGDGVFALFDSTKPYTALAATVSAKTFVNLEFTPKIKKKMELDIGGHFGIAQRDVLVRKLGLKFYGGRTDRQNEVWAGKPVNMAAKLASLSTDNTLWVSDRYYNNIPAEQARMSCGCPSGTKAELWTKQDVSQDARFDFDTAYSLSSNWCEIHGKQFCADLVKLDE